MKKTENTEELHVGLKRIQELVQELNFELQKLLPKEKADPESRLETHHLRLLEYTKKHGYINDRLYAGLTTRAKATRSLDFQKLISLGRLKRLGKGKATYYKLEFQRKYP